MTKYVLGILTVFLILSGCDTRSIANAPDDLRKSGSARDEAFMETAQTTLDSVVNIVIELETGLRQLQAEDELDEAKELMRHARQDILFHWNRLRNEVHPESEQYKKVKKELEDLLSVYREGLSLELKGMNAGDPVTMKRGYELTEESGKALQQFKLKSDDG